MLRAPLRHMVATLARVPTQIKEVAVLFSAGRGRNDRSSVRRAAAAGASSGNPRGRQTSMHRTCSGTVTSAGAVEVPDAVIRFVAHVVEVMRVHRARARLSRSQTLPRSSNIRHSGQTASNTAWFPVSPCLLFSLTWHACLRVGLDKACPCGQHGVVWRSTEQQPRCLARQCSPGVVTGLRL